MMTVFSLFFSFIFVGVRGGIYRSADDDYSGSRNCLWR